ncbi:MAG: antitoxin [Mariprofundaceae bacterium]
MSRLTIDITEQQHQALKAMAALEGKTIKQFTLERLFKSEGADDVALDEFRALLAGRVAQAQQGDVTEAGITEVAEQSIGSAPLQ